MTTVAKQTLSTERMISAPGSSATDGEVVWMPEKSIWTGMLTLIALALGPLTFNWDALALFLVSTAITICAGHSVGMHRLLIHRSFQTSKAVEYILVYLGTLVGMAGPFGMIHAHDIRDWAQRQRDCHPLHAHRRSFLVDAWWQMHCAVKLQLRPPSSSRRLCAGTGSTNSSNERGWRNSCHGPSSSSPSAAAVGWYGGLRCASLSRLPAIG